eukprot:364259-Chlamydomonas_euryale.AAC.4
MCVVIASAAAAKASSPCSSSSVACRTARSGGGPPRAPGTCIVVDSERDGSGRPGVVGDCGGRAGFAFPKPESPSTLEAQPTDLSAVPCTTAPGSIRVGYCPVLVNAAHAIAYSV